MTLLPILLAAVYLGTLHKLCLWRRSLCSNLGGIGPEKLYRATLSAMESEWQESENFHFRPISGL